MPRPLLSGLVDKQAECLTHFVNVNSSQVEFMVPFTASDTTERLMTSCTLRSDYDFWIAEVCCEVSLAAKDLPVKFEMVRDVC